MTKIKNTKKGMAKKTLSVSLAVAMLATSNVPVWAAEFSDGSEAAFTSEVEAPVVEETPVVEAEEVAPVAEATMTNNKYSVDIKNLPSSVEWNTPINSVKVTVSKDTATTDSVTIKATWMENGNQVDSSKVDSITVDSETTITAITPTAEMADAESKLTLYIYAKDSNNNTVWSYTSDEIAVKKIKIDSVFDSESKLKIQNNAIGNQDNKFIFNGKEQVATKSDITIAGVTGWTSDDFAIGDVVGDKKNVTDEGITVSLLPTKPGYTGVLKRTYKIEPLNLTTSNVGDYIEALVVNTSIPYTGNAITLKKGIDIKLVDKKTGADLSGYIAANSVLSAVQAVAGKSYNPWIQLSTSTEGTVKNYTIDSSLSSSHIETTNKVTIAPRSLKTVDVQISEIANSKPYTLGNVSYYDKTTGESLTLADDVSIDITNIAGAGTYTVKVSPMTNNVVDETTATLRVSDTSFGNVHFSNDYATADEEYTGEQVVKDISKLGSLVRVNSDNSTTIIESDKYKIEFGKNVNAGTNAGVIRIVGQGDYKNSVAEVKFNIKEAVVSSDSITYNKVVEDKNTQNPSAYKDAVGLVVKAKNANGKEFTLTEGTDYTVAYAITDNGGIKNVTSTITLKNTNYKLKNDASTLVVNSKITKKIIKDADIRLKKTSYTYTGAGITPVYDVVVDGRVLAASEYTVKSISRNVNVGTATLEITGDGTNYSSDATAKATFSIVAADASKLTGVIGSKSYTGYAIDPVASEIDLTLDGVEIDVNDNFTLSYGENINIGEGTVTLTPKNGNFTGTKTITFKITGKMLKGGSLKYYGADGLATNLNRTYSGTAITASKTVFNSSSTALNEGTLTDKLTEGTDYEIKYVDNVYGKAVKESGSIVQKGAVLVIAKGSYAGNYNGASVTDGIYTDAAGNKITNVIYAEQFRITPKDVVRTNVSLKNGTYAAGLLVKPAVVITVDGRTLVEGTDYDLNLDGNKDLVNATKKKSLTVTIEPKNGYRKLSTSATDDLTFSWGIDKFNLSSADVSVTDGVVTVKCGNVVVPTAEYTVAKDAAADTVTVTAAKDSKNYTGSKTVSAVVDPEDKPDAPMLADVKVSGNKATAILSGESAGATGYDYVISTDRDCITNKDYDKVNKNILTTETDFTYLQQGTYYAYCHAWKRDENGKKVFSDWSNPYLFVVSAVTPEQPVITSVKTSGSTVTVTYTNAANATGYDVVLGTATKKVAGETRPVNYGTLVKKNVKGSTVTVTFKDVPKGTYYAGLHAFNRTSENGTKVFSPWSNTKKVTVK